MRVLVDEGPGPGARADRARRGVRPRVERVPGRWPARVGTRRHGWCTPAVRPPAPRWSARWSTPPTARPAAVLEGWFALDLLVEGGRCVGVTGLAPGPGPIRPAGRSRCGPRHVVLATGGAGQLFSVTTNPPESTGDGVAMALRAGVPTADVEFIQFHPTALHHPAMPRPLLSEALRGHGAIAARPRRRAVRRRAGATRRGQPGHGRADGGPGRGPPVARCHRAGAVLGAVPHHRRLALVDRARSRARLAAHRPGRAPPLGRRGHRPVGGHRAAGPVGGGGGGLHRRARGQPAGVELAPRGHGLRGAPGRADRSRGRRARAERCPACRPGRGPHRRHRVPDARAARGAP